MALEDRTHQTILIGATMSRIAASQNIGTPNRHRAGAAFTPGMLVELYEVTNELKWRANGSATELTALSVALDKPEEVGNTGIDDAYAANENVHVAYLSPGDEFNSKLVSGQAAAIGSLHQSNGNGWLKAATATTQDAMLGRFQAMAELNSGNAVASDTRFHVRLVA